MFVGQQMMNQKVIASIIFTNINTNPSH